jgi:hypothetical protein
MTQEMNIMRMSLNIYGPMLTQYMIVYMSLLIGLVGASASTAICALIKEKFNILY